MHIYFGISILCLSIRPPSIKMLTLFTYEMQIRCSLPMILCLHMCQMIICSLPMTLISAWRRFAATAAAAGSRSHSCCSCSRRRCRCCGCRGRWPKFVAGQSGQKTFSLEKIFKIYSNVLWFKQWGFLFEVLGKFGAYGCKNKFQNKPSSREFYLSSLISYLLRSFLFAIVLAQHLLAIL